MEKVIGGLSIVIGAALGKKYFSTFDNAQKRATKLGAALQDTNNKLKSANDVTKYRDRLQMLNQKQKKAGDYPVLLNSASLAEHIALDRSRYLPFLNDLLTNPYEVWLNFEKNTGTGEIALRARFIKAYQLKETEKGYLLMVANASKGYLEGWTFIPTTDLGYINRQRKGKLIYKEEQNEKKQSDE